MYSKAYLEAKKEFKNCIVMAPFTLGISLVLAFTEWKPIINEEKAKAVREKTGRLQTA